MATSMPARSSASLVMSKPLHPVDAKLVHSGEQPSSQLQARYYPGYCPPTPPPSGTPCQPHSPVSIPSAQSFLHAWADGSKGGNTREDFAPASSPAASQGSTSQSEGHIPLGTSGSATSFFCRIPSQAARQRTGLACDKCRVRKTKCSGERPVCQRCTARGLICEYSGREARVRGPGKQKRRDTLDSRTPERGSRIKQDATGSNSGSSRRITIAQPVSLPTAHIPAHPSVAPRADYQQPNWQDLPAATDFGMPGWSDSSQRVFQPMGYSEYMADLTPRPGNVSWSMFTTTPMLDPYLQDTCFQTMVDQSQGLGYQSDNVLSISGSQSTHDSHFRRLSVSTDGGSSPSGLRFGLAAAPPPFDIRDQSPYASSASSASPSSSFEPPSPRLSESEVKIFEDVCLESIPPASGSYLQAQEDLTIAEVGEYFNYYTTTSWLDDGDSDTFAKQTHAIGRVKEDVGGKR